MERHIELAKGLDQLHQQYHRKKKIKKNLIKAIKLTITVITIGGFIWLVK